MADERDMHAHVTRFRRFTFNIDRNPFPTIVSFAKRNAGKSWTGAGMMELFPHIPRWAVWAGTVDTKMFWAERLGGEASVFSPDKHGIDQFKKIIAYQQKKIGYYLRKKKPVPECYGIGLIFDDVSSDRKFAKDEIVENFFSNGRHYHALIYFSCQYIKQLPPAIRVNIDYIVMLHLNRRQLSIIFEEMIDALDDREQFITLVKKFTSMRDKDGKELYLAVVYDNFIKSDRVEEVVRVYKQRPGFKIEDVKLGSPEWREFNNQNYKNPEAEQDEKNDRRKQRLIAAKEQRGLASIEDVDDFDDDNLIKDKIHGRKGESMTFSLDLRDDASKGQQSSLTSQTSNLVGVSQYGGLSQYATASQYNGLSQYGGLSQYAGSQHATASQYAGASQYNGLSQYAGSQFGGSLYSQPSLPTPGASSLYGVAVQPTSYIPYSPSTPSMPSGPSGPTYPLAGGVYNPDPWALQYPAVPNQVPLSAPTPAPTSTNNLYRQNTQKPASADYDPFYSSLQTSVRQRIARRSPVV